MAQENVPRGPQAPSGADREAPANGETGENERVKLRGRIGSSFSFRETKEQKPVANFSLAEHPDPSNPDMTVWHNAAVFGERATALQKRVESGELKTGMEVDVVGFRHFAERPRREGGTQMVEQIYVVSVKPVVRAPQAPAGPQTPQGQ